jgi:cbb3-type cytochrome oxidase subunit 3
MTATMVSLLAVTFAFAGLLVWVFWPSRRERLEAHGNIPFAEPDQVSRQDPGDRP